MSKYNKQSLSEFVEYIKSKEISSLELTKAYIERSEKSKKLNTYVTEDFDNALKLQKI